MTTQTQRAAQQSVSGTTVAEQFTSATLLRLLEHEPGDTTSIEQEFTQWDAVICSLPLMTEDYAFAQNWVNSSRRLWKCFDSQAATWQLRQVARRLRLK